MSEYYKPDDPNLIFIQSRAEIDPALVEEYAQMMREGVQFHPAKAIGEGAIIYVYDGFHRGEAAKKAGQLLFVSVKPGMRKEAEWAALTANQDHGMRRSNADKQKIVKLALTHEFGSKLSNRQIALHCGVDEKTVRRIREQLESTAEMPQSDTRIGADGREINTANIGQSQPAYVAIYELEPAIRMWVSAKYSIPQGQIETLQAIKEKQDEGPALLEELLTGDALPGPRRKGDVVQAVNNVLAQLAYQVEAEEAVEKIRAEKEARAVAAAVSAVPALHCKLCKSELRVIYDTGPGNDGRRVHGECPGCRKIWCFIDRPATPWVLAYEVKIGSSDPDEVLKPLVCPRCGSRVNKNHGGIGLACLNCPATWEHLRAFRLEVEGIIPASFNGRVHEFPSKPSPAERVVAEHTEWLKRRGDLPPDYDPETTRQAAVEVIARANGTSDVDLLGYYLAQTPLPVLRFIAWQFKDFNLLRAEEFLKETDTATLAGKIAATYVNKYMRMNGDKGLLKTLGFSPTAQAERV